MCFGRIIIQFSAVQAEPRVFRGRKKNDYGVKERKREGSTRGNARATTRECADTCVRATSEFVCVGIK